MRNRRVTPAPFFFDRTAGLSEVEYLVGPSLDRLLPIAVKAIPGQFSGQGQKVTVHDIQVPQKGRGDFTILTRQGETVSFYGSVEQNGYPGASVFSALTSGSSGNVAIDLRRLGVERVGVIGAVGNDLEGGKLLADLKSWGIEYGVVQADATSFTLRLREEKTGRIVMLCKKGKAVFSTDISAYIAHVNPRVLGLTSLRPAELGFGLDLFQRLVAKGKKTRNGRQFTVLVPHPDLLNSNHLRPQIEEIGRNSLLVAMNLHELRIYLGPQSGDEAPLVEVIQRGAKLLQSKLFVITMDKNGIAFQENDKHVQGRPVIVPGRLTKEVEPTGAGDSVLATLMAWEEPGKPLTAHRLLAAIEESNFVASQKVGSHGPQAIPSLARIRKFRTTGH